MRRLFAILIWLSFQACNNVGPIRFQRTHLIEDNQLSKLFVEGTHSASLVTSKELSGEEKKVLRKISAILIDKKLQVEFDTLSKNPGLVGQEQLRKKLGLTNREFDVLVSIFASTETSTEEGVISILQEGDRISFKGNGPFAVLDSLVITPKDSAVTFNQSKLDFIKLDSSYRAIKLPAGETLESVFAFVGPNNLTGLLPLNDKYFFLAARLGKSGKAYLYLKTKGQLDIERPFDQFYSIIIDQR